MKPNLPYVGFVGIAFSIPLLFLIHAYSVGSRIGNHRYAAAAREWLEVLEWQERSITLFLVGLQCVFWCARAALFPVTVFRPEEKFCPHCSRSLRVAARP